MKFRNQNIAGMGDDFLAAFMDHMQAAGTPTDFLSFHAKGKPEFLRDDAGGHIVLRAWHDAARRSSALQPAKHGLYHAHRLLHQRRPAADADTGL